MQNINYAFLLSRPVWGAWIEIGYQYDDLQLVVESRPVWGAWIEIKISIIPYKTNFVAPRMGRVD